METNKHKYLKYQQKYLNNIQFGGSLPIFVCSAQKYDTANQIIETIRFAVSFEHGCLYNIYNSQECYLMYKKLAPNKIGLLHIDEFGKTVNKFLVLEDKSWYLMNNAHKEYKFDELMYNEIENIHEYDIKDKKIIIFIRHGETITNKCPLLLPLVHNSELTDNGYDQAKYLSKKLINFNKFLTQTNDPENVFYDYKKGIEIALISPLQRTLLTAKPTLNLLPPIPIVSNFAITEQVTYRSDTGYRNVDHFLKRCAQIIKKKIHVDKSEYAYFSNILWTQNRDPPMEDSIHVKSRCQIFDEYATKATQKVILVFSHYMFISEYFRTFCGFDVQPHNTGILMITHK